MRITLEIHESIEADSMVVATSLRKLSNWYERNYLDPKAHPMTGICTYHDDTLMFKREYRKTDCFVIHHESPTTAERQGETK